MTPRWQRAELMPSWIRWLPCAFVYLTVVPDWAPFRRSAWNGVVPWHNAPWCDPGDVADWLTRARQHHPRRETPHAESHAREHYDWMVEVRAARIELFGEMCRRKNLPVPHTVDELLPCLVGFGLFELDDDDPDDPWVRPRLDRNPLDVLPLTDEERELEVRAQRDDRAVQVAIAVRRLAQRTRRRWRRRIVTTTVGTLAGLASIPVDETRQALTDLGELADLVLEQQIGPHGRVRLTVPWPDFRLRFPFTELPAPEHAI